MYRRRPAAARNRGIPTQSSASLKLSCPTCGAKFVLEKYEPGRKYTCSRCSANLLFGKFALMQELGRGGFGVVYKAWQADLERIVALKFLHTDSGESNERFVREAKIAANLSHPNITQIYEVGEHEGKLYITMQFVDGTTTNKVHLSPREAAAVLRDAALAVDYAHARDIVHRDIKPHNIMVTQERSGTSPSEMSRRTFVMDFGLARSASKGSTLTTEGQIMGTPAYMSPEQAEGRTCDSRSDVYSLGATLYTLVTQHAPFEAATPVQVLMKVTQGCPTPPSKINAEVDANLEAIILKAMEVAPEKRYATAARLAADLTRWLQGEAPDAGATLQIGATTKTVLRSGAAPAPKSKAGIFAGITALLVAAGGAVAWQQLNRPPQVVQTPPNPNPNPGPLPATTTPVPPPPAVLELLEVRSDPAGARVRIKGVARELTTPCTLDSKELPYGTHEVEILLPGFNSWKEEVVLKEGLPKRVLDRKLEASPREIALIVDTDPSGAEVALNDENTGKTTPFTLHRDEVRSPTVHVRLELAGYEVEGRTFRMENQTLRPARIPLQPLPGTLVVRGAPPGATLHLFALPKDLRNADALLGLWSENPDALEKALAALDAADAPLAADRLKELGKRSEPRIRELAARAAKPAAGPVLKPEQSVQAGPDGTRRIENAWVVRRYRILGTLPSALDFLSGEIQPVHKQEKIVNAEMTALATLSARPRPAAGRFQVVLQDGSLGGTLATDGTPLRLAAGPVTLRYQPPPGNPLLREFTVSLPAAASNEFAGNLHFHSAEAAERAKDAELAVRGFTKVLEEKSWPASEEAERGKLPERIRALYAGWIDAAEKKALADPARQVEEARRRIPPQAIPMLVEAWAANTGTRESRGAAAAALAGLFGRMRAPEAAPYEATEWLERAVKEGVDPGAETEGAVAAAAKGYPGLADRLSAVGRALVPIRKPKPKAAWLGLEIVETPRGGRVTGIAKGSPAEAAELKLGDSITVAGLASVRSPDDLAGVIKGMAAGDELEIRFERAGAGQSVKVRLAAAPAKEPEFVRAPDKVGTVNYVHPTLGIFVALDPGALALLENGETLELLRDGQVVGELTVERTAKPDGTYPEGSAKCKPLRGTPLKGDGVRRPKK